MSKKAKGKKNKNEKSLLMSEEEKEKYIEEVRAVSDKAMEEYENKIASMSPKELKQYYRETKDDSAYYERVSGEIDD